MQAVANTTTLNELLNELDQFTDRIPLEVLRDRIAQLTVNPAEVQPFIRFAPDTYRRNLMRAGPAYHALILCWRSGQRSPIHDHRGSSCGVRVLGGICTETTFHRTAAGHIFPTETRDLPAGYCCATQDADIHQISNIDPAGENLITLHIYSPPLLVMGKYSLTDADRQEFVDQIDLLEGAGI